MVSFCRGDINLSTYHPTFIGGGFCCLQKGLAVFVLYIDGLVGTFFSRMSLDFATCLSVQAREHFW